jgi:hypothetical protein
MLHRGDGHRQGAAAERQGIGLGTAAGEDDALGGRAGQRGNLGAGLLDDPPRRPSGRAACASGRSGAVAFQSR